MNKLHFHHRQHIHFSTSPSQRNPEPVWISTCVRSDCQLGSVQSPPAREAKLWGEGRTDHPRRLGRGKLEEPNNKRSKQGNSCSEKTTSHLTHKVTSSPQLHRLHNFIAFAQLQIRDYCAPRIDLQRTAAPQFGFATRNTINNLQRIIRERNCDLFVTANRGSEAPCATARWVQLSLETSM